MALNGRPLGEVRGYALPAGFDVTERLLARNELEIVVEVPPRNAEWRMGNAEWRMGNAECGMQNAECGMGNAEVDARLEGITPHSALRTPHSVRRPGREGQAGGLVREIRLEVRHQNFLDRLALHATDQGGAAALHVTATAAGPDVDGLHLHVTGMRRELAFVPIRAGQAASVEALAADLPRWRPNEPCQLATIEVRLLRHGEAVWETTLPTAVRQAAATGPLTALVQIATEEEFGEFDAAGTPVIPTVPASWRRTCADGWHIIRRSSPGRDRRTKLPLHRTRASRRRSSLARLAGRGCPAPRKRLIVMARVERDREDLLAEATALVQRVELDMQDGHASAVPGLPQRVIVGFRSSGCGSVYFGPDEAYQFNTAGELRRAYRDGELYKAERGRLVRLTRQRTSGEVLLIRHELDDAECAGFLGRMAELLDGLRRSLNEKSYQILRQMPADVDLVGGVAAWLNDLPRGAVVRSSHAR